MLTETYIDALLVDEALADLVWELWDRRVIGDELAAWAWWLLVTDGTGQTSSQINVQFSGTCEWRFQSWMTP